MDILMEFFHNFWCMFVDMAFYIMLGLLFVGIFHVFVKKEKVLKHLGDNTFSSVVKSSVVGVPLPLCSCGVVPTAIELKKSGASNGSVISFLVSTPQTGVDSILATYSIMGWVMAIFRPITAFISGIISGVVVNIFAKDEALNLDNVNIESCGCGCETSTSAEIESCSCGCETSTSAEIESCGCGCETSTPNEIESCGCGCETSAPNEIENCSCGCETSASTEIESCSCGCETSTSAEIESCSCGCETSTSAEIENCGCGCETSTSSNKFKDIFTYAYGGFLDELAVHLIVGMLLATVITTFLPADFFVNLGLNQGIISMIAMMFIGLPMYICSTSSIPIALSLVTKGLSFGGAFVFLFTGPVTNIASLLVLSKVLGKKITALYVGSVVVCAIAFGLLLDFLIDSFNLTINSFTTITSHGHHSGNFTLIISVIFALLLIKSFIVRFVINKKNNQDNQDSCSCCH